MTLNNDILIFIYIFFVSQKKRKETKFSKGLNKNQGNYILVLIYLKGNYFY